MNTPNVGYLWVSIYESYMVPYICVLVVCAVSMSITTEYMVERAPYIGYVWRPRAHIVYGI